LADPAGALGFRWAIASTAAYPGVAGGEPPPEVLSVKESEILGNLRFAQRRRKWLIGRLAAKTLIARELGVDPRAVTIANDPSGAPYAEIEGEGRLVRPLSISHRAGWGMAGLGDPGVAALGVDMETVEPRSDGFLADFFSPDEIAIVGRSGGERDLVIARTWSAKEAALKALGVGLRADTRAISVGVAGEGRAEWLPIDVATAGDLAFGGPAKAYWQMGAGYVLTAVVVLAAIDR
jgi:4'-phosphopantetheinyl transferase